MHPYQRSMRRRWPVQLLRTHPDGGTSIRVLGYTQADTAEEALAKAVSHWPQYRGLLAIPHLYQRKQS
jgi:hypothetical protein